jgi:ABC-2 type transport system ATP-binding protein
VTPSPDDRTDQVDDSQTPPRKATSPRTPTTKQGSTARPAAKKAPAKRAPAAKKTTTRTPSKAAADTAAPTGEVVIEPAVKMVIDAPSTSGSPARTTAAARTAAAKNAASRAAAAKSTKPATAAARAASAKSTAAKTTTAKPVAGKTTAAKTAAAKTAAAKSAAAKTTARTASARSTSAKAAAARAAAAKTAAAKAAAAEKAAEEKAAAEAAALQENEISPPTADEHAVVQEPIISAPPVPETAVEEPKAEEPVQEPVVEEPLVEEPVVQEPVVQEPVVEEPVVEDAPVEESAPEEAVQDEADVEPTAVVSTEPDSASDGAASAPAPEVGGVAATEAISIRGLVKQFGDNRAVDRINLTVPAGSFYGIVGPNGAGKTTTLSIVAGLLRPDEGSVVICGIDQAKQPLAAKRVMGVLPDRLRTFDRLTGRQLLYYYGLLRGLAADVIEKRAADLARAFDLGDALSRVVSDYSAGMTKKIMLAGAMIHSPRVLVLDEPFESVDPVSSAVILDILRAYVSHGGTVILSSHGMDLVERVCSRVAIIVGGEVLAEGTIDDVRAGQTLEARFVELAGSSGEVEGLEWLHTFSD